MLLYLNGFYVGLLILANIISVKTFHIGSLFVLPTAVIVFMFLYPIVDVIVEVYGKKAGRQTVITGLITQVLATVFILISIKLPASSGYADQVQYSEVLGGSFRIIVASLISYLISQNLDVFVFNKLKTRHGDSKLWLRNNVSTMTSQLLDTIIFIFIAFYGTMPFVEVWQLVFSQYLFKFFASIVLTPFLYGAVGITKKLEARQAAQS